MEEALNLYDGSGCFLGPQKGFLGKTNWIQSPQGEIDFSSKKCFKNHHPAAIVTPLTFKNQKKGRPFKKKGDVNKFPLGSDPIHP